MSRYTFTVRKRECEISLTTDDRIAIEQQIAIWVMALSRKPLVETLPPEEYVEPTFEQEEQAPTHNEIIEENTEPSTEFHTEPEQEIRPFEPERITSSNQETRQEYVEEFINNIEPENVQPLSNIQEQVYIEEPQQVIEPEKHYNNETAVTLNTLFNAESPTKVDFESILEKTVDNLNTDSSNVVKKDENFCKLVKANNITDRLELLLFTADYFCKYDARFVFSLKQINGKLMNNLAVIVDHGILKIALDNNYLEREGESEYRLTEYGRSEIYSKAGIWS